MPKTLLACLCFFTGLILAENGRAEDVRGVPATEGLLNFARVSDSLWRGAQPDEAGIDTLKKWGVATIINLRMADDVLPHEEAAARRNGIVYVNVPLPGLSGPDEASVARVLALIKTSKPPVFVHCQHGADRTGTIVACYRMQTEGWTTEKAFAEAKRYGLSRWQFGMKRFILAYQRTAR